MAEKRVGMLEARRRFGDILRDVSAKGDRYLVQDHGEPVAVVVPVSLYERWTRDRDEFFDALQGVARRSGLSPEEADELAEEAVASVRRENAASG
jgi:prevent-host-death family protein